MSFIKITTPCLIGSAWRQKGEIIDVPPRVAEMHVRSGTAIPVPPPQPGEEVTPAPPIEQTMMPPRGERAVSPRQAK